MIKLYIQALHQVLDDSSRSALIVDTAPPPDSTKSLTDMEETKNVKILSLVLKRIERSTSCVVASVLNGGSEDATLQETFHVEPKGENNGSCVGVDILFSSILPLW